MNAPPEGARNVVIGRFTLSEVCLLLIAVALWVIFIWGIDIA